MNALCDRLTKYANNAAEAVAYMRIRPLQFAAHFVEARQAEHDTLVEAVAALQASHNGATE